MKRNLLTVCILALSFSQSTYADFTFHSTTGNICEQISGTWSGVGKGYNWLVGECVYHGTGTISSIDSTGHFVVDVAVDKDSGSFVCPAHATEQLKGTCTNELVTIITNYGNLTGNFTEHEGSAKGELTVSPGLSATVDIQFKR